ncbi:hypothetical protein [Hydrogenimonas sp.]
MERYIYSARLRARICEECMVVLPNVEFAVYGMEGEQCLERPDVRKSFRQLSEEETKKMQPRLLCSGKSDGNGEVECTFGTEKERYDGECIEIVITFRDLAGPERELKEAEHYRIAVYTPRWEETEKGYRHFSELVIPASLWCAFLKKHGVWVICGEVVTCEKPVVPVSGVTVRAYDVDWIQDDFIGSAVTDPYGRFLIYYDLSRFNRTPFSPFINVEWTGGPDLYFKIEGVDSDGNPVLLLDEDPSRGRRPDRENVSHCFCTRLCISAQEGPGGMIAESAWTGIGTDFTIPDASSLNDFDAQGYAGGLKYAFTGVIRMTGQSLRYAGGYPVEYRFLLGHATADNGTPFLGESNFTTVVGVGAGADLFVRTKIGQMWRFSPSFKIVNIYAEIGDLDGDGWLDVNRSIERTFTANPSLDPADLSVPGLWTWVDLDGMMAVNTIKFVNHPDIPSSAAQPGDPVPAGDRIPIQKMSIRFETRKVIDKATDTYAPLPGSGMTLNAMVVNNNPAFMKVAMKEHLALGACSPLSGDLHVVYTVCHPHLDDVTLSVRKNSEPTPTGLSAFPIPLVDNTDTTLDHINNNAGIRINDFVTMTKCTYIVKLNLHRRLHTGDGPVSDSHVATSFYWEP